MISEINTKSEFKTVFILGNFTLCHSLDLIFSTLLAIVLDIDLQCIFDQLLDGQLCDQNLF